MESKMGEAYIITTTAKLSTMEHGRMTRSMALVLSLVLRNYTKASGNLTINLVVVISLTKSPKIYMMDNFVIILDRDKAGQFMAMVAFT